MKKIKFNQTHMAIQLEEELVSRNDLNKTVNWLIEKNMKEFNLTKSATITLLERTLRSNCVLDSMYEQVEFLTNG